MPDVRVSPARLGRWLSNFEERHGPTRLSVEGGGLRGVAEDTSTFEARLPFDLPFDPERTHQVGHARAGVVDDFATAASPPATWGVLLVRKGGFAVARLAGEAMVEHKIGQRHVQGRTKAGGQSQQRFARRRANQAQAAYDAAADHAARILRPGPLVAGGDRPAVQAVLADPRLRGLAVVGPWLAVPDPRRAVLDQAITDALAIQIAVANAQP